MNPYVNFTLLFLYCGLIYWLSDQPSLPVPMLFPHQDKVHHGGAYFIMGLLAARSLNFFIRSPILLILAGLFFCSAYGAFDEWHQSFVPGRDADAADWMADTAGAALGILFFTFFLRPANRLKT